MDKRGKPTSGEKTPRALRAFSRRALLRQAVVGGSLTGLAPAIISRRALASSGELRVMIWGDFLPKPFVAGFAEMTGIRIKQTPYGSNQELLNKMRATRGRGFDLVVPTADRAAEWKPLGLLQPFDMSRVDTSKLLAGAIKASTEGWSWDGDNHHLPFLWGTEGLAWRTDKWESDPADLSYGDLWQPEMEGRIMGRPHSMMLGIGLYLDAVGKLPSNRMLDAYKDEANMRRIWEEITKFAVEHKTWLKLFWNDAETQVRGFLQDDVTLGQTWDAPPLRLKQEGKPVTYMAPQEGALAWLDGFAMPAGARNLDEIYEFISYVYDPQVNGSIADSTSYNPVVTGAEQYLSAENRQAFTEAYPGDALDRLWWWPPSEPWYTAIRAEYRDRFVAA